MHYKLKRFNNLYDYLRNSRGVSEWKRDSYKVGNNRCYITGRVNNLEIHHVVPFSIIVGQALEELGLPLYRDITKYQPKELMDIEQKVADLHHFYGPGKLVHVEVHFLFHQIYGVDGTNQDFKQFKKDYKQKKYKKVS